MTNEIPKALNMENEKYFTSYTNVFCLLCLLCFSYVENERKMFIKHKIEQKQTVRTKNKEQKN